MGQTERTETYWRNGRLFPVTAYRPSGRGRWPQQKALSENDLVAIIEGQHGTLNITEGPAAATVDRINESILAHLNIQPKNLTTKIWSNIPKNLLNTVADNIKKAEQKISQTWFKFSNEEAITGALFHQLDGQYNIDHWNINFSFIEFSKQLKWPTELQDVMVSSQERNKFHRGAKPASPL